MELVKVKWGTVTVAKGPATLSDIESTSGGVVLSIVGKGTQWTIEVPIATIRRCLGAWATGAVGAAVVGGARGVAVDLDGGLQWERITGERAEAFLRLVRGWQDLMAADWPNARAEAEASIERWLVDAQGSEELELELINRRCQSLGLHQTEAD